MLNLTWNNLENFLFYEKRLDRSSDNVYVYKSRFKRICNYFADKEFVKSSVYDFFKYLEHNMSAKQSTTNKYISLLKHIAEFIGKEDVMKGIRRGPEEIPVYVTLTIEEQKQFLAIHPPRTQFKMFPAEVRERLANEYNARMDVILETCLKCGSRFGELRNLKWENWHGDRVRIVESKTNRMRWIPILPDHAERIEKLPRHKNGYVFGSSDGQLDAQSLNREIKTRLKMLNIHKDMSSHGLRRTCATTLLRCGVPIERVAKLLGHTRLDTTYARYYADIIDDLVEAAQIHPLNANNLNFNVVKLWVRKLVGRVQYTNFKITSYQETENRIILEIIKE